MINIISPVTGKDNVEIVRKIDSELIITKYQQEYGIDVKAYFEGVKEVLICRCKDSSYRFYYPIILGEDTFYESLQNISPHYYQWNWEHGEAFKEVKNDDHVLDIGCGDGFFLKGLSEKTTNVKGLEYNDLALAKCKEKGITAVKSDIQDFSKNNEDSFDIVCAFQVLEHISDVKSFIQSCLKVLKPGGKLIIGVPNNNPYLYKKDVYHTLNLPPHHIGLWNKKSLKGLSGFLKMRNTNLFVEPLFNYDYWFDIQFGKSFRNNILGDMVCRILRQFKQYIAGRNLLAIYTKK